MKFTAITLFLGAILLISSAHAEDRLNIEQTTILGNRELPRVTFVVPWRDIDARLPEWPLQRLVDAPLLPLDREGYRLQLEQTGQMNPRAAAGAAQEGR